MDFCPPKSDVTSECRLETKSQHPPIVGNRKMSSKVILVFKIPIKKEFLSNGSKFIKKLIPDQLNLL